MFAINQLNMTFQNLTNIHKKIRKFDKKNLFVFLSAPNIILIIICFISFYNNSDLIDCSFMILYISLTNSYISSPIINSLKNTRNIVILTTSSLILLFFLILYFISGAICLFLNFFQILDTTIILFYFKQDMDKSKQQENALRRLFTKCDIYSSFSFFNVKQESSYKTMTGGICTVIFLIVMIIIFSIRFHDYLNSNPTVTSITNLYGSTPLSMKTSTQGRSKFMFSIIIRDEKQKIYNSYFDVNIKLDSQRYVKLQQCNQSQWNINSKIQDTLRDFDFDKNYLCLPKDTIMNLQQLAPLYITITNCSTSFCLNNPQRLNMTNKQFSLQVLFVNTFINPNDEDSLTYFLDNRNQMYFSLQSGGAIILPFSSYEIQTANKQIPFILWKLQRESGVFVDGPGQSHIFQPGEQVFASIVFKRSIKDVNYKRAYENILDVFSFIGGLMSYFLPILTIILNAYNQFVFQVQTSQQIFRIHKEQPKADEMKINTIKQELPLPAPDNPQNKYIQHQRTNLFTFIKNTLWCQNKYITRYQKQINAQLDIQNIIKKLVKMQTFIRLMKEKFKDDKNLNALQQIATLLIDDDNNSSNQQKPPSPVNQDQRPLEINLKPQSSVNLYQRPLEFNLNPYNQEKTSRNSGRQNHGQDQNNGQNKGKKTQIYSQMNNDNLHSRDMINNEKIEI